MLWLQSNNNNLYKIFLYLKKKHDDFEKRKLVP